MTSLLGITGRPLATVLLALMPLSAPAQETPGPWLETSENELAAARAARIVSAPEPKADYVFGVDRLQPGWTNMPGLIRRVDYFGPGCDGVEFYGNNDNTVGRAAYWKLDGVDPGTYYVGLWVESGNSYLRSEAGTEALRTPAYLNGWPLRFATASDPVQVASNRWLCELQTAVPVALNPGDEIAFHPVWGKGQFFRLALYRQPPPKGHLLAAQSYGAKFGGLRLRVVLEPEIAGSGEDGAPLEARIRVANPLPYPAEVELDWWLADYFGTPLTSQVVRLHLEPHAAHLVTHQFVACGDAHAYQLDARTRPAPGFRLPVPRPVEMLELNDFTRVELLPALPGPLEAWRHVRKELKNDRTGDRMWVALNEGWERADLEGRRVPATVPTNLTFRPCAIPETAFYVTLPTNVFGRWYRKTFRVPDCMRGRRVFLELDYAKCEGTIFLNGQRVGYGVGGELPIRVDLSPALRADGDNELVVCVRGGIALVREDYVDRYDPENWQEREGNRVVYGAATMAGAFLGGVRLFTAPEVHVSQALVVPDVGRGTILALARVANHSAQPRAVELTCRVEQRGVPVTGVNLPTQTLNLQPGEIREVRLRGRARGLTEYTPRNPVLARMTFRLTEGGRTLDEFSRRFGYRTLKVRGTGLEFNGRPIRLLGSGPFFMLIDHFERESGTDISRCFGPDPVQEGPDACDEVGRLYYLWVGEGSGQPWDKLRNDRFWQSAADTLVELTWERGSRPGVVVWDVWNESYHYQVYATGVEGRDLLARRIYQVIQAVRERIWPDFWFISDGNEELGGLLDFNSVHYLNHGGGLVAGYWRNRRHGGYAELGKDNIAAYWPDSFYLTGAARVPKKGTIITGPTPDWAYGSTAWGDTETFWYTGGLNGVGNCKYLGDLVAVGTTARFNARGWAWEKTALDAYRDVDMAFIGGLYWHGFQNLIVQDVTFSLPEQEVRYFSGARFNRRLNIHDDEYAPGQLEFAWRLLDPQGQAVREGVRRWRSRTAYLQRDRLSFTLPRVAARTPFRLDMQLRKDGVLRAHEERLVEVWPASVAGSFDPGRFGAGNNKPPVVALFDPSGTVAPVLARSGATARKIPALDAAALAEAKLLVIGPNCATAEMPGERRALVDFVARGGRALVLEQQAAGLLPADTYFEDRLYSSLGFVRAPAHPVMQGLRDLDFQVWNPGHLIARGMYRKPATGNVLALVDCGHDNTMAWTPLFEIFVGQGSVLVCQLPIIERMATEPVAAELWQRLLRYLYTSSPDRQPTHRLNVLAGASEPVRTRLKQMRVEHAVVSAVPEQPAVLLVEMNQEDLASQTAQLMRFVTQGGTLLLHRVRPEHASWLTSLLNRPVAVEVQPYEGWIDRQILERRDGLVAGLNNLDFYWRPIVEGEGGDSRDQVSARPKQPRGQVEYVVRVAGVPDYLYPGGLVEVRLGSGRVIMDQIKWEMAEDRLGCGSPKRILSMLLTNLGVIQHPPPPKPVLPANVRYVPIDIAALANRGLVDEVSGDGVGWLEWGPGSDLRDFPQGTVTFDGIPFQVPRGDKNVIMLRVNPGYVKALADYPDTVVIPIGRRNVAGLWFLHTGGWAYGDAEFGRREIVYDDGTREVIVLNGANMADWNYGRDQFPDEEGTLTSVAWRGSNAVYAVTRVYKTLWVNPHPEKEIREVILTNRGLPEAQWRVMPHFAITAAILEGPEGRAVTPGDPALSRRLLAEARDLLGAGNTTGAVAALEDAVRNDGRNVAAWQALAEIYVRADDEPRLRDVFARWRTALPDNYVACNMLGGYLERKGQKAEALKLYRQSLDLEWNQPPVLQAIQRLERELTR